VLFWSENCFWGYGGATAPRCLEHGRRYPNQCRGQTAFEIQRDRQLTAMIRVHRNHPSIIAWSMSNEPFFTADATKPQMSALLTKRSHTCPSA